MNEVKEVQKDYRLSNGELNNLLRTAFLVGKQDVTEEQKEEKFQELLKILEI